MYKKTALLLVALASLSASPAMAEPMTCIEISNNDIAALFTRWEASLHTGDADKVVENYAKNAVLLPTVSNKPRKTPDEIRDYFEHFLQKKPKGKIDTSTIHIGCNEAFDVGTYTFELTGSDGSVTKVPARYTFIYQLVKNKWLITHHHSSAMPEKVTAGAPGEAKH